ncbi:alpha-amylase family glycosyl hydrolase [Microcoleus sp. F4-D5]|uniref:alpha-amylase family glycosyl hydrolase n=1 Tax=Microcoleus sp. F4-D5 TaxID=2818760 RepID=UPI0040408E33
MEKLDYLCDLRINAIELMAVNEYPGDYSCGYKVRDFFAVESSYGGTADVKRLIDECQIFRIFARENLAGKTFDIEKLKQVLDGKQQGDRNTTNAIDYFASHDRDCLLAEASFRILDREIAFKQAKLGAVLLVTAGGIPMLWMGEEFGQSTRETPNQPNKLQWSLLKNQPNHELLEYHKHVIRLRRNLPSFYSENLESIAKFPKPKCWLTTAGAMREREL